MKKKAIEKYFDEHKIRYFQEFPETSKCPVCGTNSKDFCVLVGIDGTGDGSIEEAAPVHIHCLITRGFRINTEVNIMYQKLENE